MKTLYAIAIETSTRAGGVAIAPWTPGKETPASSIAEKLLPAEAAHASLLLPILKGLLERFGASAQQMGLIAVGVGPGSYTGLRVGIASALALAQAGSIPLVAVPSLETVAEDSGAFGPVAVLANAYGGEVYFASFERGEGFLRETQPISLVPKEKALGLVPAGCLALQDALPKPSTALRLGMRAFAQRGPDAAATIRPLYLRPSRAEIQFLQQN